MTTNTKLPTYPVEFIEAEVIVLETPRIIRDRTRFQQFIDNIALAIVTGSIAEQTVQHRTTPAVFDAVLAAITSFDELDELYRSRSTLEGGINEYLNPEHFSFRKTPNGYTT